MEEIRRQIFEELDTGRELSDEEIFGIIDEAVCREAKHRPMSVGERYDLRMRLFYSFRRLDILQELVEDDGVSEIMVNGAGKIFYEREGQIHLWEKSFESKETLEDIIQQMAGNSNRMVNEYSPIVDTRLVDGSRVNIVLAPIALDGSCISIRKFPKTPLQMEDMVEGNSLDGEVAEFLKMLVKAKHNIFISGGTGSGKTTFLNALSAFIPESERIITIEDSAELQIQGVPNLVRLETRNANVEEGKEIGIRDLIRTALRMRPDRIIVGEVRGAEALDMLQAMNTGHDGSLSTGHANSSVDMLRRLETMVLMGMELPVEAIRGQIAAGLDILVHLGKLRDKSRKVLEISEILGYEKGEIQLNPLYAFQEEKVAEGRIQGIWKQVGELRNRSKLRDSGLFRSAGNDGRGSAN